MKRLLLLAVLVVASARAASPDTVVCPAVPCNIAASITAAQDSPELIRLK
jgi:hypothetical protein